MSEASAARDLAGLPPDAVPGCTLESVLARGSQGLALLARCVDPGLGVDAGALIVAKLVPEAGSRPARRSAGRADLPAVSHGGLARILGGGTACVGSVAYRYVLQERVVGTPLRTLLRQLGRLPEPLVRHVGARLADALEALHAAGIVHRDVKPDNVLLTPGNELKLIDLDVAGRIGDRMAPAAAGGFAGSLGYAAPEQVTGGVITGATDLHALGVTLLELVTGVNPLADRERAGPAAARAGDELPRARESDAGVTPFLDAVIASACSVQPERRFASAAELGRLLDAGESSDWWLRRRRSTAPAARAADLRRGSRLHGRDAELRLLRRAWSDVRKGRGRLILVEGEGGVGKSRLVEEIVHDARTDGACVLVSRHSAVAGIADVQLSALVEHFGRDRARDEATQRLADAPDLAAAFGDLAEAKDGPGPSVTAGVAKLIVRRLALSLAADGPAAWIVEDAHLAASQSLDALAELGRALAKHRLLLVVTTRPAELGRLAKALETPHARRVALKPLSQAASRRALADALGGARIAPVARRRALALAAGSPFLLEVLGRAMGEDGGSLAGDQTHATRTAAEELVPFLVRRLATLDTVDRELVEHAALLGHEVEPALLARVLERNPLDVVARLSILEQRSALLRSRGGAFEFHHHLVHAGVLASMPSSRKEEAHARIAVAKEIAFGTAGSPASAIDLARAVDLARHHLSGGDVVRGRELAMATLGPLAVRYLDGTVLAVTELLIPRLEPDDHATRAHVLLRRASTLMQQGATAAAGATLDEAIAAARASGDKMWIRLADVALGTYLIRQGETARARVILEAVALAAREEGDAWSEIRATRALLLALVNAREDAERAAALADRLMAAGNPAKNPDVPVLVFRMRALMATHALEYETAVAWHDEALEAAKDAGPAIMAAALADAAFGRDCVGRRSEAVQLAREALVTSRRAGLVELEQLSLAHLAATLGASGDLSGARRALEEALEIVREAGWETPEAVILCHAANFLLALGRPDEAEGMARRAARLAATNGLVNAALEAEGHLALVALARGDHAGARSLLSDCIERARRPGLKSILCRSLLLLAKLDVQVGRRHAACSLFREVDDLAPGASPGLDYSSPRAWLAWLGELELDAIELSPRMSVLARAETHWVAWRAGAGDDHLVAATDLLDGIAIQLDRRDRASFREGNRLARAVRRAHAKAGASRAG